MQNIESKVNTESFKDFLEKSSMSEARARVSKRGSNTAELELQELNKDRVGKAVLRLDGTEFKNSIVLDDGVFVFKDGRDYNIEYYSVIKGELQLIHLSKKDLDLLNKL